MTDEIQRLRLALRDLVALSTIPAAWVGREAPEIAAGLADLLMGMLYPSFAFVRLRDAAGEMAFDVTRGTPSEKLSTWLDQRLAEGGRCTHTEVMPLGSNGSESARGLCVPLGVAAERGLVVVACDRRDFPTETDQLLLSVAANQAVTAFQSARLVHERRRAEEALREARDRLEALVVDRTSELRRTVAELAHFTRVTTLGELGASIAHEINQPLAAIVANAEASLNWLARAEPQLHLIRDALTDIVEDSHRAADVIRRIRQLATKRDPQRSLLDINDVIQEVLILLRGELLRQRVSLRLGLSADLPPTVGDRVQLQQVLINLVMNGVEAMESVSERPRELLIRSFVEDGGEVRVAVQDAGVGLDPVHAEEVYNAFFTTKASGMGMGLSISRSIIESHGGRLWATSNPTYGATFQFALPVLT